MMRGIAPLALSLVLLLAGCSGHSNVQLSSGASPAGGVSSGGSVQAQSNSPLAVLIAIGVLMGASYASDRQDDTLGSRAAPGFAGSATSSIRAPAMDNARRVLEVDCTKPIEDRSANLRCK